MKTLPIIVLFVLNSCATYITPQGQSIRPVTSVEKEKYACDFLGIVTGSHGSAWTTGGNHEYAMNETRNKVAEMRGIYDIE
jgi:hypothetical protein